MLPEIREGCDISTPIIPFPFNRNPSLLRIPVFTPPGECLRTSSVGYEMICHFNMQIWTQLQHFPHFLTLMTGSTLKPHIFCFQPCLNFLLSLIRISLTHSGLEDLCRKTEPEICTVLCSRSPSQLHWRGRQMPLFRCRAQS